MRCFLSITSCWSHSVHIGLDAMPMRCDADGEEDNHGLWLGEILLQLHFLGNLGYFLRAAFHSLPEVLAESCCSELFMAVL